MSTPDTHDVNESVQLSELDDFLSQKPATPVSTADQPKQLIDSLQTPTSVQVLPVDSRPEFFGPQDIDVLPMTDLHDGRSTPLNVADQPELLAYLQETTPPRSFLGTVTPARRAVPRKRVELKRGSLSISRHRSPLTMPTPQGRSRRNVAVRLHVNSPFRQAKARRDRPAPVRLDLDASSK